MPTTVEESRPSPQRELQSGRGALELQQHGCGARNLIRDMAVGERDRSAEPLLTFG
jgi:hypothetical protein